MTKLAAKQARQQQELEAVATLKAALRALAARSGYRAQTGGVSVCPITDTLSLSVGFCDAQGDPAVSAIAFIHLDRDLLQVVALDAVGNTHQNRLHSRASAANLRGEGALYLKPGGRVYASGPVAAILGNPAIILPTLRR